MKFFSPKILTLSVIAIGSASFAALEKTGITSVLSKEPFEVKFEKCVKPDDKSAEAKGTCLRNLAKRVNKPYTIPDIDLSISKISDSQALQWCHEFMHYAGWEIYKQTQNIADAFSLASNKCDSGMYHGVTEEYISEAGGDYNSENFIKNIIPNACEAGLGNRDLPPGMKAYCYHGLGHAFMFITENDLNRSLGYCDYTGNSSSSCYSGSLMENIQSKQIGASGHTTKFGFNSEDPDFPCKVLDQKYKKPCYVYKGINNVVSTKGDFKKSFEDCSKVDSKHQEDCLWGVGSNIPGPHWSSADAGKQCDVAMEISPDTYKLCIRSAMSFLVPLNIGKAKETASFCNVIKDGYKDICYAAAGKQLKHWVTPNESLSQKCQVFESPSARAICEKQLSA